MKQDFSKVLVELQPAVASAVLLKRGMTNLWLITVKLPLISGLKQRYRGQVHQGCSPFRNVQTRLERGACTGQRWRLTHVCRQRHTLKGTVLYGSRVLGVVGVGRIDLVTLRYCLSNPHTKSGQRGRIWGLVACKLLGLYGM